MSFLQSYNYSYVPNAPPAFPQPIPQQFGSTSSSFNTYNTQLNAANTIPIPQSIIPNPNSPTDYYGNPNEISNTNPNPHTQTEQQRQQIASLQQQQQLSPLQQQALAHHQQQQNLIHQQQQLAKQQQKQQEQQQQQQQQQYYENPQQLQEIQQQPQQPQQDFVQPPQNNGPRKRRPKNSSRTRNAPAFPNQIPIETEYNEDHLPRVTPIQGPIFAKDGYVPVVPLYSYKATNNGTFYQIPILWTALSYALGLEIRGEILRGLPCIKRLNQLFCPTAGNTYPLDNIERFIDENKALIKRMYGEFIMNPESYVGPVGSNNLRRSAREIYEDDIPDFFGRGTTNKRHTETVGKNNTSGSHIRTARQTVNPRNGGPTQQPKSNRVDSCESTVEIVTPYWAANSSGKVRAIVNTQHFEQAIHQEVCAKGHTKRCSGDCGCEQKYKWHRLLAYDPDNDCRGIFMDWFLFPSCCVCRCNP